MRTVVNCETGEVTFVELTEEDLAQIEVDKITNAKFPIYDQIKTLEAKETPRRLSEAILTPEGAVWLQNNRAQITALRAQLVV